MATERTGSVTIRPARASDMERLGSFGAALMALHHEWDLRRFIPTRSGTSSAYANWLAGQLDNPDTVTLVAERDGEIAGYTNAVLRGPDYMSLRGPAGVINDIFVDPGMRKAGIGKRLLQATVAELAARGADQMVLSTAYVNETAQRLFAAAGFRPTMIEMTLNLPQEGPKA